MVPMLLPRSVLADLELRLGLPTPGLRVVDLEIDLRVLLFTLLVSSAQTFNMPARQTLVFDLVPRRVVPNAVALSWLAFSLARASRNPALEELYFHGAHPGNFAFENGDPNLKSEHALGFDASFRWRSVTPRRRDSGCAWPLYAARRTSRRATRARR